MPKPRPPPPTLLSITTSILVAFLLLSSSGLLVAGQLTVDPATAVMEIGQDVTFTCTHGNSTAILVWAFNSNNNVNDGTNTNNNNVADGTTDNTGNGSNNANITTTTTNNNNNNVADGTTDNTGNGSNNANITTTTTNNNNNVADGTTDNTGNGGNNANNNSTGQQQPLPPNISDATGRVTSINGTLTIRKATLADSGQYTCRVDNLEEIQPPGSSAGTDEGEGGEEGGGSSSSVEVTLTVYEMPDYLLEGLLVGGLCALLLAVLVGGIVMSMKKEKKKLELQKKGRGGPEDKMRILTKK